MVIVDVNWNAIGAISAAVASIVALFTTSITIKANRDNNAEKQFAVQPWFHVTHIERMGGAAPLKLILSNDASSTIRINEINLIIDENNKKIALDYKYLKKDSNWIPTGKYFEVIIKNDENLFGKTASLEVYYTNLYNKRMKAVSPSFKFVEKSSQNPFLYVESSGFLYIPFVNEIIKK